MGCAHSTPVVYFSRPEVRKASSEAFDAQIEALKTLGFRSKREVQKPGQNNFYPAILPNGLNSVALVVTQGAREWKEVLTVQIGTLEVKKQG